MPNEIRSGNAAFAADLSRCMAEAGDDVCALCRKLAARDTKIDSTTIRKYLCLDENRNCSPSRQSNEDLIAIYPSLMLLPDFAFEERPEGGEWSESVPRRRAQERFLTKPPAIEGPGAKYRTTSTYRKGNVIDHPKFGLGRVLVADTYVSVLFASGETRRLLHRVSQ